MPRLRFELGPVLATMLLFAAALVVNEWVVSPTRFVPGINWIVPACRGALAVHLCCLPKRGGGLAAGVVAGLLFPLLSQRPFVPSWRDSGVGGTLSGLPTGPAPLRYGGFPANWPPFACFICVMVYSIASPLLHHVWFAIQGSPIWPGVSGHVHWRPERHAHRDLHDEGAAVCGFSGPDPALGRTIGTPTGWRFWHKTKRRRHWPGNEGTVFALVARRGFDCLGSPCCRWSG